MRRYPTLSGETTVVPIIGDPIAQVKSPHGITALFAERGVNSVVVQLQIAADLIRTLFVGLVAMLALAGGLAFGLGGKEHASRVLDQLRKDISSEK